MNFSHTQRTVHAPPLSFYLCRRVGGVKCDNIHPILVAMAYYVGQILAKSLQVKQHAFSFS